MTVQYDEILNYFFSTARARASPMPAKSKGHCLSLFHTRLQIDSVIILYYCTHSVLCTVWAFDPTNVYSHIFLKHPLVQVLREDGLFALVAWEQWRYIYMQNVRLWEKAPLPYAPPLSAGDIFRNWSHFLLSAASLYSPFSYFCGDKIHY